MGLEIGIDTGGTFTDAAIVTHDDDGNLRVLATAKALTTKGDLSVGVSEALTAVLQQLAESDPSAPPASVSVVTVSTTLATNAVVEGQGDRVGIVLIGFDDAMVGRTGIHQAFPDCPIARISGGHNHAGFERSPLDQDALRTFAKEAVGVSAFAVASMFGNRNPEHERLAATLLNDETALPVSLSTDLTGALDAPRRALTSVLNARLIGKIRALITAVESSVVALGLNCPVMLVKGDGTRAKADEVRLRPVETVMSGPAASTIGVAALSGLRDCIMSDVGGTTTDIAILQRGRPALTDEGALVGGWKTLVRAADVRTHGLGGDSAVHWTDGPITLGPQRVVPVSLLAHRFPNVFRQLHVDMAEEQTANAGQGRFVTLPFETTTLSTNVTAEEAELLQQLVSGPVAFRRIAVTARITRRLVDLEKRGLIITSALTVSDAAHVLGQQTLWPVEAAQIAVTLAARVHLMRTPTDADVQSFAANIIDAAITHSGMAILDACSDGQQAKLDGVAALHRLVASGHPHTGKLSITISPTLPIVAVGGPAPLLYPEVGNRLGTNVLLLKHGAVANAVGAAIGPIHASVTIGIENTDGVFRLVGNTGAESFGDLATAVATAHERAETEAIRLCIARGSTSPTVDISETRTYVPGRMDDNGLLFAEIIADATGRIQMTSAVGATS
jgi:N-methylhydantoinase A/oxoprolinase/acetone carboxylase beta subunit